MEAIHGLARYTLLGNHVVTLQGATGAKNGVKSGGFWQPLSQDVAFCCNVPMFSYILKHFIKPSLHCAWPNFAAFPVVSNNFAAPSQAKLAVSPSFRHNHTTTLQQKAK